MDARKSRPKGRQIREVKTKQMEGQDLESVIERAQGHDAQALGEIHRRYVRRVFGLCRYMLDSRESAEEGVGGSGARGAGARGAGATAPRGRGRRRAAGKRRGLRRGRSGDWVMF